MGVATEGDRPHLIAPLRVCCGRLNIHECAVAETMATEGGGVMGDQGVRSRYSYTLNSN